MTNLMNEGMIDRALRLGLGAVLLIVAIGVLSGIVQIIAGVLSAILLLTGAVGVCPLYLPFGIRTNGAKTPATRR
jgi:uncharacterized membrane protein YkgB